jgi:hypothetical protein
MIGKMYEGGMIQKYDVIFVINVISYATFLGNFGGKKK